MIRQSFNDNWMLEQAGTLLEALHGVDNVAKEVTLPHDAMIIEERTPVTKNAGQTGFYPGGNYEYIKNIDVPMEWKDKTVILEFEGVYMNGRVFMNGDYAGGHPNGYSNFYVCADGFLKYGEKNEIKVIANTIGELNTRWYSGSGIYRNVKLMVGNLIHIIPDGVRIRTQDAERDSATVLVETTIENKGFLSKKINIVVEIKDADGNIVISDSIPVTSFGGDTTKSSQRMVVANPSLWDCDNPYLYVCEVRLMEGETVIDESIETFGIRKLQLDAVHGLRINGKEVKMRGACIHHDNGIIGATTLERSEERRCEQLKAAGFNSIRSAHHPISKAMLYACDRLGMLVMDELTDMWTRPKNSNDYSQMFPLLWEKDVELMVGKDFNHPCVVLYSMGNEIPEDGTARGAQLNRRIHNKFKELDPDRYTTNAINGVLACINHMEDIMEEISNMAPESLAAVQPKEEAADESGSNGLNNLMTMLMMMGPIADAIAVSNILAERMDECASGMDVAGYNYLTALHEKEKELHPNRVIIGSETFPSDIVRLWDIVKKNPHVIGDMTWTGYDYLGEAGIGIFYYDGTINFQAKYPDRLAYCGDIDLIGHRRTVSYLREIVYGLRKEPYMAVMRMNRMGQTSSMTPWMWKDNIASWTWSGYEGQAASVDVYADADVVELFLNGVVVGKKSVEGYITTFELSYEPGELKAVGSKDGVIIGAYILKTASDDVHLDVSADRTVLKADGADLSYITVGLKDDAGIQNLYAAKEITVHVEGVGTLQGYGNADPQSSARYDCTTWNSYDGYVLAAIRSGNEAGEIKVTFKTEDCEPVSVVITVEP